MAGNPLVEMVRIIRRRGEAVYVVRCPVEILVTGPPGPVTPLVDAELPAGSVRRGRGERLGNHPALADDCPRAVPGLLGHRHLDAHHVPFVGGGIRIPRILAKRKPVASVIQRQPDREIPVLLIPPRPILKFVGVQGKHAVIIPFEHHELVGWAGQKQHAVDLLVPELGNISRRPNGWQGSHHIAINGQDAERGRGRLDKVTVISGIDIRQDDGALQSSNHAPEPAAPGNTSHLGNIKIDQCAASPGKNIHVNSACHPRGNLATVESCHCHAAIIKTPGVVRIVSRC